MAEKNPSLAINIQALLLDSFLIIFLGLGAVSGFLAGLLGIGGGLILVPAFVLIFERQGYPANWLMQSAVATSLGTIFFSSLASVFSHHRHRAVLWEVLPWLGIGALGGTLVGAQIASVFSAAFLAVSFGLFQLFTAWKIFFPGNVVSREERPSRIFFLGTGSGIGLLSSFLGVGGGFLTVPLLLSRGFPVHAAVGTSAGIGFFIALGGILGFSFSGLALTELPPGSMGFVYLPACLASAVTSLLSAPLGASLAHAIKQSTLKKIFGSVVLILGVLMLKKSWDLWQVETLLK